MNEWRRFCVDAPDITLNETSLTVRLGNNRNQRIDVRLGHEVIELHSIVARRAFVEKIGHAALMAWERNRASSLVGFSVDNRGRLIGECWIPAPGLTRDEFLFYVRSAAAACDLFEFQLSGKDEDQ